MSSQTVRLATYNIGNFTGEGFAPGSAEGIKAIREAMGAVGADLWSLQEDAAYYDKETQQEPYGAVYDAWKHYERRGHCEYNYKAFLSDHEIRDVEQVPYVGEMRFRHPWFLRGTVTLAGREICLINVHLDWSDKLVRYEQIRQVLAYAEQYDYRIIMGDFNPDDYVEDGKKLSDRNLFLEELPRFTEAGYIPANGGAFGVFGTFVGHGTAKPIDNILVCDKLRIAAAGRVAPAWMNDHVILWADIVIA